MSIDNTAWWYIGGLWVHPNDATLSISDLAILRCYSVFESLRTYNRHPFHLDEHLERLYRSASLIELDVPYTHEFIRHIVHEVIERNSYKHATLRLFVTGGESEDGIMPTGKAVLAILITALTERNVGHFSRGTKLITTHLQRALPDAKTSNYVAAIQALKEAVRHGASDALFVNERGHVLEATRSNFFIFRGDILITPRVGILIGVTRNVVLGLARDRFPIEERPIQLEELSTADEAFITSSSREIMPVVQINDWTIGDGKPGPRTYELEQHFIELVEHSGI